MSKRAKQQCDTTKKWFKEDFNIDIYDISVCDNGTTFSGGEIIIDGNKKNNENIPQFYYGYEVNIVYNIKSK